jgi:hypothetical protein
MDAISWINQILTPRTRVQGRKVTAVTQQQWLCCKFCSGQRASTQPSQYHLLSFMPKVTDKVQDISPGRDKVCRFNREKTFLTLHATHRARTTFNFHLGMSNSSTPLPLPNVHRPTGEFLQPHIQTRSVWIFQSRNRIPHPRLQPSASRPSFIVSNRQQRLTIW